MITQERTTLLNSLSTLFADTSSITASELRQGLSNILDYAEKTARLETGENGLWDIAVFGAKGDGISDDTAAIQSAINTIMGTNKGGTIRFANRTYLVAGNLVGIAKSQLVLPDASYKLGGNTNGQGIPIRFIGEVPLSFVGGGYVKEIPPQNSGAIIYSTQMGSGSIIGAYGTSGYYGNLTNVDFSAERMVFRTKGGSAMSALDLHKCSTYQLQNILVDKDVNGYYSPRPAAGTYGIRGVETGSQPNNYCLNTLVIGYETGYQFGEHATGDQIQAYCCYNGIEFTRADHNSSLGRVCLQWCKNGLIVSGLCRVTINSLDIENISVGNWYDNGIGDGGYHILDPNNYLLGGCNYSVTTSLVGRDDTNFFKSGGNKFYCVSSEIFNSFVESSAFSTGNSYSDSIDRSYTGQWVDDSSSNVYSDNHGGKYSTGLNEYFIQTGKATSTIEIWSPVGSTLGSFKVLIDDIDRGDFTAKAPGPVMASKLLATISVSTGTHSVKIVNTAGGTNDVLLSDKIVFN